MTDTFKKMVDQALDLYLVVHISKRSGEWTAELGDELDSLSLKELKVYRAELEARLCDMDDDEPESGDGPEFELWTDMRESLNDLLRGVEERIDELG